MQRTSELHRRCIADRKNAPGPRRNFQHVHGARPGPGVSYGRGHDVLQWMTRDRHRILRWDGHSLRHLCEHRIGPLPRVLIGMESDPRLAIDHRHLAATTGVLRHQLVR